MIETIYIEQAVIEHQRTIDILARFPDSKRIHCQKYGEVFNRSAQNFRLQKIRPALILAKKHNGFVLPTPSNYGIGASENYYFSHMNNCLYDCRYCFLQGMYRSAHYLLFINYEDFAQEIESHARAAKHEIHFFSGYDCDSLALEPITGFIDYFLPIFQRNANALLEIRTKSTQIRSLLAREPLDNCILAWSFTPTEIAATLEHKTPTVQRRIEALNKLQQRGWRIGLRFDPLIYSNDYKAQYRQLFHDTLAHCQPSLLHSVSLGNFRLPKAFFKRLQKMYPYEPLFASPLANDKGMLSYKQQIQEELLHFCSNEIRKYIPEEKLYYCDPITTPG